MLKYGIEIIQRLDRGILGGKYQCSFPVTLDSISYEVSIVQLVIRKVSITTGDNVDFDLDVLIEIFNKLDMLIMLGEGQFIPIEESKIITNGVASESDVLKSKIETRCKMFNSADFTIGSHSTFLSFEKYIDESMFIRWTEMLNELDILHHMVLYSMSDTGMTVDFKSALLIESFEALSELIEKHDTFKLPEVKRGESKLQKYLCAIIKQYGVDIFSAEINSNLERICHVFVNSRNRIAHIKTKQNREYLNAEESALYAVKMSFLYRSILLILLGVDYSLYSKAIKESIDGCDRWNNTLNSFLAKIK